MSVTDDPEAPPTPGQPAEEEPGWKAYYDFDEKARQQKYNYEIKEFNKVFSEVEFSINKE